MFQQTTELFGASAATKAAFLKKSPLKYFAASGLAGLYVGLGIFLIFSLGAPLAAEGSSITKLLMGVCFGIALTLVLIAGSELFTGNNMIMTIGIVQKTSNWADLVNVWLLSWVGNLVGALLLVGLVVGTGLLANPSLASFLDKTAAVKESAPFFDLVFRGILCNILVCLAIWMAARVKEDIAKMVAIFWCLFAFITSGYEHSIANMTILALPMFTVHSDSVTWGGFFYNIGAVTLGNAIGGAVFVGGLYSFISAQKTTKIKTE